jgi:ABC-2 type transport system ATP-binding protein
MSHVGVMLQAGGVYPGARVAEMVRLMASFAAAPLDVPALLDRLGLTHVASTAYRRLSGGEKQRLGLALAIVGRPEVVILDEPTAGMDTQVRHDTLGLIEELRAAGVSVLLTTHLLDEAERLADDVVILHRGRVVATGSPAELTAATGIERLQVGARPGLPLGPLRAALPAGLTAAEPAPGEYAIGGITDPVFGQVLATVTAWCEQQRAVITDLRTERRTLEQVFLALIGTPAHGAADPTQGAAGGPGPVSAPTRAAVVDQDGAVEGSANGTVVGELARLVEPAGESEVRR